MLADKPFYQYHQLTKHTVAKLMSYEGHLDWANQPDPFRVYRGAKSIPLPVDFTRSPLSYFEALQALLKGQERDCPSSLPPAWPANLVFLSHLLYYSMAVSAWKQIVGTSHRWALRVNPSSGNLHPTETHILAHAIDGLECGAYHYRVDKHVLEMRAQGDIALTLWQHLGRQSPCPEAIIVLTSIFWREAWKYRQRAYRYCQHDMGHALGSIMLSAATLGFSAEVIGEFPDHDLACLLGIDGGDEAPSLVIGLHSGGLPGQTLPAPASEPWAAGPVYAGEANCLSQEVVAYPAIDSVYQSTCLTKRQWQERLAASLPPARIPASGQSCAESVSALWESGQVALGASVHEIVRRRRSAVDMDGKERMSASDFASIIDSSTRGFSSDFNRPAKCGDAGERAHHLVHLYAYVHRVDDLVPGIYYCDRHRRELTPLVHADERDAARYSSCFQEIAADGCFSLSMVADLALAYEKYGDRGYRYVHYEAGLIGQWLYLGATALGYEATGIGCFIDDVINELLGVPAGFEVIYNFTVGRAVLDPRLTTLPAYDFD